MDRGGNIHATTKIEASVVKEPVREGGMSEQEGTLIQGC